ncbi:DUF5129 domain-containing protein [Arthrobacter sp. MYb213]|uniref:DUF5129 domain-containing protein n=1 Tax=Arthrobacter sp. MYb213 TaxID=1848595 RepID=UPI000CFAADB5|nr:DUF5129 domain-containing protein [Arthrobacter sp. MYb213]PRB68183.1 hypothetical protein CQ011_14990 [Arthrobacter sp. MYb213]
MSRRGLYDSRGRKLHRPRSWAALGALLMALVTTLVAVQGFQSIPEEPGFEVAIVVEGTPEWNISQATVDAALSEPIKTHRPLRLIVTDRHLSGDELLRGQLPAGQVLLSTQLENLKTENSTVQQRFTGAALNSELVDGRDEYTDARFEISGAFRDNLGLGHGPQAVVAAAERAAIVLSEQGVQNPVYWFGAIGLCAMLTAALLYVALRYRSRWGSRHRRLIAAQRKLARVLLDLEALEATYAAAPAASRPAGFSKNWEELQSLSLQAARGEDPLVASLFTKKEALGARTGAQLAAFEASTRTLTQLADALLGAGSVHANLAGTGSTFDQLSRPINDAATALLIRLEQAPGKMVSGSDVRRLRDDLGELLQASALEVDSSQAVDRWRKAEKQLATHGKALTQSLRRYPRGKIPAVTPVPTEHLQLRESLGLKTAEQSSALYQLGLANALVRATLGDTLASDTRVAPQLPHALPVASKTSRGRTARSPGMDEPAPRRRGLRIAGAVVTLIAAMIVAGLSVGTLTAKPEVSRGGSGQGVSFEVDDPAKLLDEDEVLRYMDTDFQTDTSFTLAVRDAESYLDFLPLEAGRSFHQVRPRSILEAKWRLKSEFKDKVNPLTGELREGEVIVPVLLADDERTVVPGVISAQLQRGDYGWGRLVAWEHGSISESKYLEMEVAGALDDYNNALARNGYEPVNFSATSLFWMLTFLFCLTVINLVLVARYLLSTATRLGRFGRGARSLAQAKRQLEALMLGLEDSQINAVAVLGADTHGRADEAGQRLFERALVMAWHEAQELSQLPLDERLGQSFARRVAHLERLVARLGERDQDVTRRANDLVAATRGAGGDEPASVLLPS